jgi:hypothetical protein
MLLILSACQRDDFVTLSRCEHPDHSRLGRKSLLENLTTNSVRNTFPKLFATQYSGVDVEMVTELKPQWLVGLDATWKTHYPNIDRARYSLCYTTKHFHDLFNSKWVTFHFHLNKPEFEKFKSVTPGDSPWIRVEVQDQE